MPKLKSFIIKKAFEFFIGFVDQLKSPFWQNNNKKKSIRMTRMCSCKLGCGDVQLNTANVNIIVIFTGYVSELDQKRTVVVVQLLIIKKTTHVITLQQLNKILNQIFSQSIVVWIIVHAGGITAGFIRSGETETTRAKQTTKTPMKIIS